MQLREPSGALHASFIQISKFWISLATVTPSLVTVGEPNFLSINTLRPFGPSVTLTASASVDTPRELSYGQLRRIEFV